MPLVPPQIDDRTFEQILSDLRLRIPRYTKEWTNFNDSDPGMTLVQLFAWLSEMMLFRMNQVPLKNYVKFLKLLGQELEPAKPAVAHLTFTTNANTPAQPVPARSQVSASLDDGGLPLIFETEQALDLIRPPLDAVGVFDGATFINASQANKTPGTKYRPLDWSAEPGNALYLGFTPPDPMPAGGVAGIFPEEMTFRVFLPPEATAGKTQSSDGAEVPPTPPVTLAWEYRPADGQDWKRLQVYKDESVAFLREGYIQVEGPQDIQPSLEPRLNAKPMFWIRIRLDAGAYPAGTVPEIDFLRANTVDALNLATVRGEILGESEGHPGETFNLQHAPVYPQSLQLTSDLNGDTQAWSLVSDFLSSRAGDRHYTLNPVAGTIQFGDGDNGLIPEPSAQIIATEYRYGGGARGNGALVGSITSPLTTLVGVDEVTNERAAVGGADEETLDDLQERAPALLRRGERAVTVDDFKSYVEEIGGIARAKALPSFHPDHRGVDVPGAITVVIVPDNDDKPPKPSGDLIRQICVMLNQKRLLTTELFVKGPEFQEIRVEALVSAKAYASFDTVTLSILTSLDQLLDPRQMDFGQPLFPTTVYSALKVQDVVGVLTLNLYVNGIRWPDLKPIPVPPDGLLFGQDHFITVQPAVQ